MIRIIFLSLVTLTLACGNTRPKPADAPIQTPVAEPAPKPADEATPRSGSHAGTAPGHTSKPTAETAKSAHTRTARTAGKSVSAATAEVSKTTTTDHANGTAADKAEVAAGTIVGEIPAEGATANPTALPAVAEISAAEPATAEIAAAAPAGTPASAPSATGAALAAPVPSPLALQPADKPVLSSRRHFLPTRRRIDREIDKLKFAYKGEVMAGLTASFGTLSSDNTDFLTILTNINADASIATVKPFFGYFYSDNHAVGVRLGYSHVKGTLNNGAGFDLGPSNDISGDIPYIDLKSNNYSFGIFHRSYAGLDPKGRFGLFAEFELSMSTGSSEFAYEQNDLPKRSFSDNMELKLSFNPGAAVYIFPNVCATLSFGLGGIKYTSVTQKDENGNKIGSRKASKMNFKLNIAAINIGLNVHLWDKKKK